MAQALGRKRFLIHRMVGTALAAVVLTGTLLGGIALRESDQRRTSETQAGAPVPVLTDAPAVRPAASNLPTDERTAFREGVVTGSGVATSTTSTHVAPGMGGLLDLQLEQAIVAQTHSAPSLGEGLVDLQLQQIIQRERSAPSTRAYAEQLFLEQNRDLPDGRPALQLPYGDGPKY